MNLDLGKIVSPYPEWYPEISTNENERNSLFLVLPEDESVRAEPDICCLMPYEETHD